MEIKINFVRAITDKTGPIRAEAARCTWGADASTAEGKIVDANGTLYAHGTTTWHDPAALRSADHCCRRSSCRAYEISTPHDRGPLAHSALSLANANESAGGIS
jgi:hypothetical protein